MKNCLIGLSIVSFIFFTFSCKDKPNETQQKADSLSLEATSNKTIKNTRTNIIKSNFEKIQTLAHIDNDTVYITNYWATWCPPCVKEIPDFVDLQEKYKNKRVKFAFVNVNNEEEIQTQVIPFVEKNKMKNLYHINISDLMDNIGSLDPQMKELGIPITVIQKKNNRELFLGDLSRNFLYKKIEEYLTKK